MSATLKPSSNTSSKEPPKPNSSSRLSTSNAEIEAYLYRKTPASRPTLTISTVTPEFFLCSTSALSR
jgi:hypothetical protein